jgi:ATP-binding cassette subfamily B (MDR/TAP) protein 1
MFCSRYTENLQPATAAGIKRGMFSGLGAGMMWFIIYCSYAIAFWYGVTLILESRENGDFEYTPGILVIVSTKYIMNVVQLPLYSYLFRFQTSHLLEGHSDSGRLKSF